MGILRKFGATLTAAAFVGVGALSATTSAEAAPQVAASAQKSTTAPAPVGLPPKAAAKTTATSNSKLIAKYRIDRRCLTKGRVLCINKKTRKLVYVVNGKPIQVMDVRFGAMKTPTRSGVFKVYRKSKNHVSSLYHSKMPYAMFFSGGQAVHYSSDFKARGYNGASHGCVNVRDKKKIAWVFARVKTGDKVVVYSK
ncbi:lipoprotein-anchoring transpeptidase ErfK/SrfK [Kribbella sp. VKM Ac-2569]|uniref:L,D-transpeptidase n=1 Tax=Kribbella sp. VKM Ac-2569 TaxID=2512220 RepID=UPI00102AF3E6|nr:L,D-transpeptidase [Kribbella sp. VKM Ac-2569]RZT28703.1 lipoprotein-anchoring transpeptidase ErfK/SrfK [Kribbella sp. VKM Ac-2569]